MNLMSHGSTGSAKGDEKGGDEKGGEGKGQARVLAGSAIGIAFGSVPFFVAGFPILAGAFKASEHWTGALIADAASLFLLMQIAAAPLTGALLDRFGTRRVASVSIVLFAAALLFLASVRTQASLLVTFGFIGLSTAGTNVIAYARAITLRFGRRRGMTLGFASAAQAVGVIAIPTAARLLIGSHGWPWALTALAAVEIAVCLPAAAWLLPAPVRAPAHTRATPFGAILRLPTFRLLGAGAFVQGLTYYAVLPNLGLVVSRANLSASMLALCTSLAGLCFLAGRLATGVLLDRLPARAIGPAIAAVAACSLGLFALARTPAAALVAGCLLGLAGGGETDLMPYAAGRYAGTGGVSRGYGVLLVAFFAGAAAGPVGLVHASSLVGLGPALGTLAVLQLVPALLLGRLLPYPPLEGT